MLPWCLGIVAMSARKEEKTNTRACTRRYWDTAVTANYLLPLRSRRRIDSTRLATRAELTSALPGAAYQTGAPTHAPHPRARHRPSHPSMNMAERLRMNPSRYSFVSIARPRAEPPATASTAFSGLLVCTHDYLPALGPPVPAAQQGQPFISSIVWPSPKAGVVRLTSSPLTPFSRASGRHAKHKPPTPTPRLRDVCHGHDFFSRQRHLCGATGQCKCSFARVRVRATE